MPCGERERHDGRLATAQQNHRCTHLVHDFAETEDLTGQISTPGTPGQAAMIDEHQRMLLRQSPEPMRVEVGDDRGRFRPARACQRWLGLHRA